MTKKAAIQDFTDLEIWRLGRELTRQVYNIARSLKKIAPQEEWITVSQVKRAVQSICANIAEAYGRFYYADRLRFLYHARGSLKEVKNFLLQVESLFPELASDCNEALALYEELNSKLNSYIRGVKEISKSI